MFRLLKSPNLKKFLAQKNSCKNLATSVMPLAGRVPQRPLLHGASVNSAQEPFVEGFSRTPSAKFCLLAARYYVDPARTGPDSSVFSSVKDKHSFRSFARVGPSRNFRQIETKSSHSRPQLALPRTRVWLIMASKRITENFSI